jgi:menaquinone-dependent protoporphyrinogen oxidase
VLVIYGSTQGQCAKISAVIAEELRAFGCQVELRNSRDENEQFNTSRFDGIVAGASVHASGYQKSLVGWVRKNNSALLGKPSAFFSVCLGIFQEDPAVLAAERRIVEKFFVTTGWRPAHWAIFAGALSYSKYNFFMKWIMRRIARKAGGGTDTSQDYEYTEWREVRRFARDFADLVTARRNKTG